MLYAAGMVMLFVVMASVVLWIEAFRKLTHGIPLLPVEPRLPAPWGLLDIVVAILIWFTLQFGVMALLVGAPRVDPENPTAVDLPGFALRLALMAFGTLAATAISMLLIRLRTGATLLAFGFSAKHLLADLRLGLGAFVMLAPPVYALQLVLVKIFPQFHPLIDQLRQHPDALVFAASGLSVMVAAPLGEEYLFRGLLQGWLENLRPGIASDAVLLGSRRTTQAEPSGGVVDNSPALPTPFPALDADNPYAASPPLDAIVMEESLSTPTVAVARWPLIVSALLFALAHYSHGPAPIPLFFLALGLGYLYQRTHRLTPCITVHCLLNSWTMVLMLIEAYGKPAS